MYLLEAQEMSLVYLEILSKVRDGAVEIIAKGVST
jgi:hypothetical protein